MVTVERHRVPGMDSRGCCCSLTLLLSFFDRVGLPLPILKSGVEICGGFFYSVFIILNVEMLVVFN